MPSIEVNNYIKKWLPLNLQKAEYFDVVSELISYGDTKYDDKLLMNRIDESLYINRSITGEELYAFDWWDSDMASSSDIQGVFEDIANINNAPAEYFSPWVNLIEPYVGTESIQQLIIDSLNLNGYISNWYDTYGAVNTYDIILDEFPGWDIVKVLIESSTKLKNIESKLKTIRDNNCAEALRFDIGRLNIDKLSGSVSDTFLGVGLCFFRKHDYWMDVGILFSTDYALDTLYHLNGGIALGVDELGNPYTEVRSEVILSADIPITTYGEYDQRRDLVTGIVTETIGGGSSIHTYYLETIPGYNFNNVWDIDVWDASLWETGTYVDRVRELLNEPLFNFIPGVGLNYYGYENEVPDPIPRSIYETEIFFAHTST